VGHVARLLPVLAVVAIPFAGAANPAQLVAVEAGNPDALVLLDASGGGAVDLTHGKPAPSGGNGFSFSPDGSRLVYVSGSFSSGDLYVLDVNRDTVTRLTTGGRNRDAMWSPDGGHIAYLHSAFAKPGGPAVNDELWVVAPDGTNARRLVARTSGGSTYGLEWSPDSTRIMYSPSVVVVDAATGRVLLQTDDGAGSWSPDGSRIAVSNPHTIEVINADGSGRHTVAGAGPVGGRDTEDLDPLWSPDGTRIVFTREICGPTSKFGCNPDLSSIYMVGADGSGERRLTGPISTGPGSELAGFPNDDSGGPGWWPDGLQLFFAGQHRSILSVMNADGTCERPFRPALQLSAVTWRPGAAPPPPLQCVDLRVRAIPDRDPVGLRGDARVHVTVENDGNESATNVKLTLRLTDGKGRTLLPAARRGRILPPFPSCRAGSALECDLDPLAAGQATEVVVAVTGQKPTFVGLDASVATNEATLDPAAAKSFAGVGVLNCDIVGTAGPDVLVGTPGPDRICGLAGPDVIRAGAGNDWIEGGSGGDTIYPGPGRDVVVSWGPDRIYARDGERDVIDCGGSVHGVVYVDRIDKVTNCGKRIVRRP
jgi:Tol biopolymer transport system component